MIFNSLRFLQRNLMNRKKVFAGNILFGHRSFCRLSIRSSVHPFICLSCIFFKTRTVSVDKVSTSTVDIVISLSSAYAKSVCLCISILFQFSLDISSSGAVSSCVKSHHRRTQTNGYNRFLNSVARSKKYFAADRKKNQKSHRGERERWRGRERGREDVSKSLE